MRLRICEIQLKNFKTFKDLTIEPSPDFNIIIGENSIGKSTSLCSTCTKQKLKIGGINRLFSLIQLIRPLPHNLTVTILRLYHNPIFL